jgi:hypothetical protein
VRSLLFGEPYAFARWIENPDVAMTQREALGFSPFQPTPNDYIEVRRLEYMDILI